MQRSFQAPQRDSAKCDSLAINTSCGYEQYEVDMGMIDYDGGVRIHPASVSADKTLGESPVITKTSWAAALERPMSLIPLLVTY